MAEEVEDLGVSVEHIANDPQKLEELAGELSGENVVLDSEWTDVKQFEMSPTVRAVLLRKQESEGVARVNGNPSRYTLTSKLTATVIIAAKPDENISILGYPTVRYFRRCSS